MTEANLVRLADDARQSGRRPVVLIDGGAGSGKSTLARLLADTWGSAVQVVSLDALYPGWHGLAAASDAVAREVLRDRSPGYRRWDWTAGARAEWVSLDRELPLIVEGCGALTPAARAAATLGVWCELDEPERRRRALARPSEPFDGHWDEWAVQEAEHWRRHRPWELADRRWPPRPE